MHRGTDSRAQRFVVTYVNRYDGEEKQQDAVVEWWNGDQRVFVWAVPIEDLENETPNEKSERAIQAAIVEMDTTLAPFRKR